MATDPITYDEKIIHVFRVLGGGPRKCTTCKGLGRLKQGEGEAQTYASCRDCEGSGVIFGASPAEVTQGMAARGWLAKLDTVIDIERLMRRLREEGRL